jgi:hypothetical protein
MNINDYFTKVKNLTNVLASIGAHVDDEDLMVVTLNGLRKFYNQFCISIIIRGTFFDFQELITILISEEMKMLVLHLMEDHKKVLSTQILIEVKVEVKMVKPLLEVNKETCMVDIINMKVSFMEVDEKNLEEEEVWLWWKSSRLTTK